jgi:hypothetical protein
MTGAEEGDAPFTGLLRSDAVMLMVARKAMEEHGDGPGGALAARLALDAELRAVASWPTGGDYLTAAADYQRAGRLEDAVFLRRVAGADRVVEQGRAWWNHRYADRPRTPADDLIASMREGGLIDFDPAGPYLGIDGAAYEPGVLPVGEVLQPVLVVSGRGGSELISGWPDYAAMSEWVATRGTTSGGPLLPPPDRRDCRVWEEDQVLARLVSSPSDASTIAGTVPPSTFTTDVRYDTYQAILNIQSLGAYTPGDVVAELARRMTVVPDHGLSRYGGPAAPFARAYLNRLAETVVDRDTAMSVASTLVREDNQYRSRALQPSATVRHCTVPAARAVPETVGVSRPGQQPDFRGPQPFVPAAVAPVPRLH